VPLACLLAGATASSSESPGGKLQLEELVGVGWNARGLDLDWRWGESASLTLRLTAVALELEQVGGFHGLDLDCPRVTLTAGVVSCPEASVQFVTATDTQVSARLAFRYDLANEQLELDLRRLDYCDGRLSGAIEVGPAGWHAALAMAGLKADCLMQADWIPASLPVAVTSGALNGQVEAAMGDDHLELAASLAVRDLTFSDVTGNFVGEELGGKLQGHWRRDGDIWESEAELRLDHGVLFRDPLLLDAEMAPLEIMATVHGSDGKLEVSELMLDHGATLTLSGRFDLSAGPWALESADIEFTSQSLEGLYTTWLQPYLIGTALDDLDVGGAVRGRIHGVTEAWQIEAEIAGVDLLDRRGRFSLGGLQGNVAWGDAEAPPSRLQWAGGQVLRLALGGAEANFTLRGGTLTLLAPLRQPLVDGALAISALEATGVDSGAPRVKIEANLEPVSLEALGYAFGWPPMAGQIGGVVPSLTYADGTLAVDGTLRVDIFDGVIRIHDPRLEHPLGPLAALHADVEVAGLDLELLTRTFTIGRIEGRLGGRVDGLLLHDWRPVRFDAELMTPPGDTSRRRISQRAVNSITSVGGLGGVLSQSVLRFFDEFGYSRLGFRCRLRGAVCELDGVEPAAGGYYLVKGGGLPRIDIIGHVRRVDWAELVDRLQRAMASPAPVVE